MDEEGRLQREESRALGGSRLHGHRDRVVDSSPSLVSRYPFSYFETEGSPTAWGTRSLWESMRKLQINLFNRN